MDSQEAPQHFIPFLFILSNFSHNANLQLVMRKNENNSGPYPPTQNGDQFKQEVFKRDNKIPNLGKVFNISC